MRSLRSKLVLYISVLIAGLIGATGVIEVRKRSAELNQELIETSENFSAISAPSVLERTRSLYYQPARFPELEAAVRQVMVRNRALTRVQVVDTLFGIVLFDSIEFEEGYYGFKRTARVFDAQQLLSGIELNQLVRDQKDKSIRVVVPLFAGKEIADPRDVNRAVVFDFSTAGVEKALAEMRLRYALQALLFLLIGIALAAVQSQAITRPVRELTKGANKLARGDLDHRVKVRSKDELGALGRTFNEMAGSLQQGRIDLVTAMEQLELQNVDLKEMDKLKDQFLANTSHELRTPINGILGLVSAVLDGADGPLNPKQANHLRMVKESGDRLKNLITNILDFSKLKAGRERFEIAAFRLSDLAVHVAALGEGLLQGKMVTIAVELPDSLPPVFGDHERVLQVLTNLVGNAAKFTEKGHIRVYTKPRDGELMIAVEDTGPGIPPEAREYLFQEFRQVDGTAARQFEGTGLGLAISKQLVTAMNGRIDFKSEVGRGTTFFFTLPTRPGAATVAIPAEVASKAGARVAPAALFPTGLVGGPGRAPRTEANALRGNGETIMVIDDQPANVEALRLMLIDAGYRVLVCLEPRQCIEMLKQTKVQLVLSDVRMPGMTGLELCRQARATPELHKIPIFLVTAQASTADDLHAATEAGADAYVLKPYEPEDLLERIHDVLKPKPQTPRGMGQRILVVDDRAVAAEGLAAHLQAYGYEAVTTTDPAKVIEVCALEKPALAVIDVRLGTVTGYEVTRQLRADARFSRLPIILASGLASPTDRMRAREVGAQEFIAKPFAIDDFMNRIAFHLKQASAEQSQTGRGEKVLVVDDVPVNVEALAVQLEHRGYVALRALSGKEALKLAKQHKPQVVISDVMMPGMTGYDLCREIQADAELGNPPVILLTAKSGTLQDKLQGFDAGAIDYVIKPFETEELLARLGRLLHRAPASAVSSSQTGITRLVQPVADVASASIGADIRGSGELVMCVDDNPINLEVLKTHLEAVSYRTLMAKDGLDALEKLENQPVELILLDAMMPRMTGYQFLERLRKEPKWKDIPVVMLSAKDRSEDSLMGFKLGVVDYVTKPFNPLLLAAKVGAIISLRRAQSALGAISSELNVARLVQQASFPEGVLDLAGYGLRGMIQCADSSGGDWYGYFTSPNKDRLTVIAGDVTGHGISAALVALAVNSIKTTVELIEGMLDTSQQGPNVLRALEGKVPPHILAGFTRLFATPHSPAALAGLINEVFCQSKSFLQMSASVVSLHLPTGELRYTLAGAPKPLLLKKVGDTQAFQVNTLASPAARLLGQDRQAKYNDHSIILGSGEAVVLYSDGVTEAESPNSKPFGTQRLAASLTKAAMGKPDPARLRDGIVSDLFHYTEDAALKDDVTVVVLQRQ